MPTRGIKGKIPTKSRKRKMPSAGSRKGVVVRRKSASTKSATKKKSVIRKKTTTKKKAATKKAARKNIAKKTTGKSAKKAPKKTTKKLKPPRRPRDGSHVRARKSLRSIEGLLNSLNASSLTAVGLYAEIESLADFIQRAKADIAALRPDEVKDQHLPKAGEELQAIVEATADATHKIMDAAETIENVMARVDAESNVQLLDVVTSIYEACSFQDITGQRINKVVQTLRLIENKIDDLMRAFGDEIKKIQGSQPKQEAEKKEITDQDLLEGPQLVGQGKNQAEIDALLASFD